MFYGESDCVYVFIFISEESLFRRTGFIRRIFLYKDTFWCWWPLDVHFPVLWVWSSSLCSIPLLDSHWGVITLQWWSSNLDSWDPEEFHGRVKLFWLSLPFPSCWLFSPRLHWIQEEWRVNRWTTECFAIPKLLKSGKSCTMLLYNGEKVTNIALCSQACHAIHWPLAAVMPGVRVVGGDLGSG